MSSAGCVLPRICSEECGRSLECCFARRLYFIDMPPFAVTLVRPASDEFRNLRSHVHPISRSAAAFPAEEPPWEPLSIPSSQGLHGTVLFMSLGVFVMLRCAASCSLRDRFRCRSAVGLRNGNVRQSRHLDEVSCVIRICASLVTARVGESQTGRNDRSSSAHGPAAPRFTPAWEG